jgi:hypothetical protein
MAKRPPPRCDPSKRPLPIHDVLGVRARVHLNLHNGCYVVTIKSKVVGYAHALVLDDVTAGVSMSGYRRCRDEGVRNVHAFLEGVVVAADAAALGSGPPSPAVSKRRGLRRISYNCLTHPPCFFYRDGSEACFESAERAVMYPAGLVLVQG